METLSSYIFSNAIAYLCAFLLGALAGAIELANRYKDAPFKVLFKAPGISYWLINGLVAIFGLFLVNVFDLNGTEYETTLAKTVSDVLIAGLGSMVVFRSSVLNIKQPNGASEELPIGPNLIVLRLLKLIDREVDRVQAIDRTNAVVKMCEDLDFNDMAIAVSKPGEFVMQNLEVDEWQGIKNIIDIVDKYVDGTPAEVGAQIIALNLYDILGKEALVNLVAQQRDRDLIGPSRTHVYDTDHEFEDELNDPELVSEFFQGSVDSSGRGNVSPADTDSSVDSNKTDSSTNEEQDPDKRN